MIKRRPERIAGALLVTALLGALSLLTHPSGGASAASPTGSDLSTSIRYGCASATDSSFVEVTLKPGPRISDSEQPFVVQVGLAGKAAGPELTTFTDAGPSLISLGTGATVVRLAGTVHDGDQVFIRQQGHSEVLKYLSLPTRCQQVAGIDYGLQQPDVFGVSVACTGSAAVLDVSLTNHNQVADNPKLQQAGMTELDYTLLLVNSKGLLSGDPQSGKLVSFTGEATKAVKMKRLFARTDDYRIRMIGPDGSVLTVGSRHISCNGTDPHPTRTLSPTPIPTATAHSTVPRSTHPSHSRVNPTPTAPASHQNVKSSTAVVAHHPSSGGAAGQSSPAAQNDQPLDEQALGDAAVTRQPVARAPAPNRPSVDPVQSRSIVADPPHLISAFRLTGLFSGAALLIVLVFGVAMAGLIGNSVRSARRR